MKPLIKICGINDFNVLQQLVCIDNINYLGFIFYEKSVRNVSKEFLVQVKEFELKDKRPVCVYVNSDKDFIIFKALIPASEFTFGSAEFPLK